MATLFGAMYQDDMSALRVADGLQPLFMASRPGYLEYKSTGRQSCDQFIREMRSKEIRLAVVLLTSGEMEQFYGFDLCGSYRLGGIEPLHYPIQDGYAPEDIRSFHVLVRTISERLARETVLVHCNAGLGRTGTVAAGLLVLAGVSPEAAITRVRRARSGALENRMQESFIHHYHRLVSGRASP